MTPTPFRIDVPDEALADLRLRLTRTRFTEPSRPTPWAAGTDPEYLRRMVAHWADGFGWRDRERELNAHPQFVSERFGRRVHFVHVRAVPDMPSPAVPLILSHGWPSSFVEMLPLVSRLTDPARHGADPADAFDVVVPSLPGFLFSDLPDGPMTRAAVADIWSWLMTEELGYERFGAFGGDVGSAVTHWLAARYPEQVIGMHSIHPSFPTDFDATPRSPAEQAYVDALQAFDEQDEGYSVVMATRPDTIAAALMDSPAGLAAWIVDKYRDWSDCGGDLSSRFSADDLLTILTLYWVTGTIGSSFRQYVDYPHNPDRPSITVPVGITLSSEPPAGYPRMLAERAYPDLRHWSEPGVGGHFMAMEEPDLLAEDLRSFFRPLRDR